MDGSMIDDGLWRPNWTNNTSCNSEDTCNESIDSPEKTIKDVIAIVRMLTSTLSVVGALSIILSALFKKQACSPKIHPIFALSVADLLLAVLWIVGATFWFISQRDDAENYRYICFLVSIFTVFFECVAVNLTVVYAIIAYFHTKKTTVYNILLIVRSKTSEHLSCWKLLCLYLFSWFAPFVVIAVPIAVIENEIKLVERSRNCSCWCLPEFGNVLPYNVHETAGAALYGKDLTKLVLTYAVIVATHYFTAFVLLTYFYAKILLHIRNMRRQHRQSQSAPMYGATEAMILRGHSQAKKRVRYFLAVFIVTGFCNLLLALTSIVLISVKLNKQPQIDPKLFTESPVGNFMNAIFILQAFTLPLQGFLNALVYGWTREDFLHVMSVNVHGRLSESIDYEDTSTSVSRGGLKT